MVIAPRWPSFRFLVRIIDKLPALARTPSSRILWQPIDVRDVASAMVAVATYREGEHLIDIGGPQVLTFFEITERIAAALGVDKEVVDVPSREPDIAARELTKITGDDPAYMQPLMETLAAGDLVARHAGGFPGPPRDRRGIADSIAAYRAGARTA